jgi:hypothetical protein
MPSSRGDARAAGRARTGGAKRPGRKLFPDPLTVNAPSLRLRLGAKVYLEIKIYESSSSSRNQKQALALTSQRQEQHAGLLSPCSVSSHKREQGTRKPTTARKKMGLSVVFASGVYVFL